MTKPILPVNQSANNQVTRLLDPVSNAETRALLRGIQGNILKAHGRHHTANVFIRCRQGQQTNVKQWLTELVRAEQPLIRSALVQVEENARFKRAELRPEQTRLFACIHISAAGYDYLLGHDARLRFDDTAFQNGMREADLNDPPLAQWDEPFRRDTHLMLLLAHADRKVLSSTLDDVKQRIAPFALTVAVEHGNAIFHKNGAGIEHFGYVDGVSQPLFFEDEWQTYLAVNDIRSDADIRFDPRANPSLVLVPDPFADADENARGSYFVFRKLEQNVGGFKEAEEGLAAVLGLSKADEERAGAMLIGRFEDGTPVEERGSDNMSGSSERNNFSYGLNDASRCPFHAHIRKTNPRFEAPAAGNQPLHNHMMARRGITYGQRDQTTDPQDRPTSGVGLLFMSYQASIIEQFEFIQKRWVNDPAAPHVGNATTPAEQEGLDPIIGQGTRHPDGAYASTWRNPLTLRRASFDQFVHMKGGEYFFAPSMAFLRNLANPEA